MASPLKLRLLEPDRVRTLEWQSEDTTMAEIVGQLSRMSARLAHGEAGDDEHPHPRNCVMNMVALVDGGHVARKVGSIMADLAVSYAETGRELAGEPSALWIARHMQGPLGGYALAAPAAYVLSVMVLVPGL